MPFLATAGKNVKNSTGRKFTRRDSKEPIIRNWHQNSEKFYRNLKKPIISIQGGVSPFYCGYPFLQYFVDFEGDIEGIFRVIINNKE